MIDITELPKAFKELEGAYKFAEVDFLTQIAKLSQGAAKESLRENFTLKNTWTEKSVVITPAKTGMSEPFSEVFVRDKDIAEHEEGVSRPSDPEGQPIPNELREAAGIAENKVIPKSLRVKQLLKGTKAIKAGNKPFYLKAKNAPTAGSRPRDKKKRKRGRPVKTEGIYVREGKERTPLILLYTMRKRNIKIKPRRWYEPSVNATYESKREPVYNEAVDRAIERWLARRV